MHTVEHACRQIDAHKTSEGIAGTRICERRGRKCWIRALASHTAKVADLTTSHAREQRSSGLERVRV